LGGEVFTAPLQFINDGVGDIDVHNAEFPPGTVQLNRIGALIANAGLVEPLDEEFWTH